MPFMMVIQLQNHSTLWFTGLHIAQQVTAASGDPLNEAEFQVYKRPPVYQWVRKPAASKTREPDPLLYSQHFEGA